MADHEQGSMDITDHEKTFAGFVKFGVYTIQAIIVAVILLAVFNA